MSERGGAELTELEPDALELVEFLKETRGLDLAAYKPPSLLRRIRKRMDQLGIEGLSTYRDYLEVHPDEYVPLLDTILINVTRTFRDPEAWSYLETEILPEIIERRGPDGRIRAWTAGCSSGEETYSLAMLLAKALGDDVFRERVRIYATDIDDDALATARAAMYTERELENVPVDLRDAYFVPSGTRWAFRPELRRSIIFGRHDLLEDPPMSKLDLLLCRNTLMYLNRDAQERVLERFHFALRERGVLFVGRAELLLTHEHIFKPLNMEHRMFEPVSRSARDRYRGIDATPAGRAAGSDAADLVRLGAAAFDHVPEAQIVIDAEWHLAIANEAARRTLDVHGNDLGRPFQDMEISYRPIELRSLIEDAYRSRRPARRGPVERTTRDETQHLDVLVTPILTDDHEPVGAVITFTDVTEKLRLREEHERSKQELETTNEELQTTNEELETTNEELQSTVEELETTNEELQSTNEELETMNEELQSTNAELQTVNLDYAVKTDELDEVNLLLEAILESVGTAVVVVDADLWVLRWMRGSEELFGLRPDEAEGRLLLDLEVGLPVAELEVPVRACLGGSVREEARVDARDRLGRSVSIRITCTPIRRESRSTGVVIVIASMGVDG